MIKNSELALISDEALDAILAPRPAPAPRATTRRSVRRVRRAATTARADRTAESSPS